MSAEIEVYAVVPPKDLADFGRWLNEWGDIDLHTERGDRAWKNGYEQAVGDAYDHFNKLMPDWAEKGKKR